MKPLTLEAVNRAVKSLRVSTRERFYESAEEPYKFGIGAALDLHSGSEAGRIVAYTLCAVVPSVLVTDNTPPVGVVIDRVNEALRRGGFLDG